MGQAPGHRGRGGPRRPGYTQVKRRQIDSFADLLVGLFYLESFVFGQKSDVPVGLRNGRYLLIECKVSGSEVNSYKRLNHETVNKRDTWEKGFAAQAYTGAVLGGVFRPANVLAAQDRGVYIFWEHDLSPLVAFLDEDGRCPSIGSINLDAMEERASAPVLMAWTQGGFARRKRSGRRPRPWCTSGVDLHRKVSHVVALGETGEVILSRRFVHDREAFRRVFGELEPEPVSVAFEATYGWGWFADLLADAGIEAHMAHPLATKAISAGRVNNDAVDAGMLAQLLRTNLLPQAWIAPPEVREARRLVRMRASLVRIRSRLKCQVHALCVDAGVPVPVSDLFGRTGRGLLATLSLRPTSAGRLAAHLRLIDDLGREIVAADREIVARFRGDDRIRRLAPIPGIGFLTAATVVAEVWRDEPAGGGGPRARRGRARAPGPPGDRPAR